MSDPSRPRSGVPRERPRPRDVGLVVFDLDGVLVDTQDAENGALAHLGELMGVRLSPAEAAALFSGKRLAECIDLLAERGGRAPPPGAVELVRAKCEELIGPSHDPVPGVAWMLPRLRVPACVASNSPREIIERRLAAAGILGHFGDRLYSAYDIEAWKPDPRLFLWAADRCGTPARECVVVEDSAVGVDAALAAGMRVLQFTADPAAGPHRRNVPTFSSMRLLPGLVRAPGAYAARPSRTVTEASW